MAISVAFSFFILLIMRHQFEPCSAGREVLSSRINGQPAHPSVSVSSLSQAENGLWNQSLSYRKCHQCHSWFSHRGQRLTFHSLHPLPLPPHSHPIPHLLLSLSLSHPSGEMPCVSSTVQRKPKTRKILLKGVSQQPDINILLVCRAECKPLGICGFTRVCVSVCAWVSVYSVCCIHLYVSCPVFFVIQNYLSGTGKAKVCWLPQVFQRSRRIQLLAVKHIYFRSCTL